MVRTRVVRGGPSAARGELLLMPVAEGDFQRPLRALGRKSSAALARRLREMDFRGRPDEVFTWHGEQRITTLGLGAGTPGTTDAWRRAGARGRQEAERQRVRRVGAYLGETAAPETLAAFVEGFLLAGYRFGRYLSNESGKRRVESLVVASQPTATPAAVRVALTTVETTVGEVFRARDWINEPASVKTPRFLAEQAERLAAEIPRLEVEAWEPDRIAHEGLAGLLAVARGSREEPRFITLHYLPAKPRRHVALVGKAITFDSGGLTLKPGKSMETMKYDMSGGAAVIGAVAAAARLELPVEITAYVPATENLPGGRAQKPGDIIRYLNGKTVEVLNTDAEGRLVLADALALATRGRVKPDVLIDLATLTGACRVALGNLFAGVMGNDQALVDALVTAGREAGEPLWQLPLVREYRDDLKSPIADLKNVGGSEGGSIVAGLFLQEFVDGVPWAHLDIAGPAFTEKELPHAPRGGTGFGVRLLLRYLQSL